MSCQKTICALMLMLAASVASGQTTWYVDDSNACGGLGTQDDPFCTIQAGIDEAVVANGDDVLVADGTYFELINFNGKAITLRSIGGAAVTIIDGSGLDGSVVSCFSGETPLTVLDGFTITGGTGTTISNNALWGGGMFNFGNSSPTVRNCAFIGNSADFGGGMRNFNNSNPAVTNCTFSGNSATSGGGMANEGSSPTVSNCTFNGNIASSGSGIFNVTSSVTVTNCILRGSTVELSGATFTVSYSNVQGVLPVGTVVGSGNIDADPFFVDAAGADGMSGTADDDLRLGSCSPSVDAGDNDSVPVGVTLDLDGNPRFIDDAVIIDTGNPGTAGPPVVDMGAYERQVNSGDNVISVPFDFTTIQAAIDASCPGGEIVVQPGIYDETINFNGKAVTLRSADGAAVTTIDGGGAGSVLTCASGEGQQTVLDGFTITGGTGTDVNGSPWGGGMFIDQNSSPTVRNCTFSGNTAFLGGGMQIASGLPTVTNCTFSGNLAGQFGGGLSITTIGSPSVTNCTFSDNSAPLGGGIHIDSGSSTVTNCTFSGNMASANGGAMFFSSGQPTVTNCTFSGNSAARSGGAITSIFASRVTFTNCTFSGNSALTNGGVIHAEILSRFTFTNCTFNGNSADNMGGVIDSAGFVTMTNSILWGNTPDVASGVFTSFTFSNSNVQGGLPAGSVDGNGNIDANPLFVDANGADNIVGTVDDDLRLLAGSPCIDSGDNAQIPADTADLDGDLITAEPTPFDLDGNVRVIDGDVDAVATVDMGAYELECSVLNLTQSSANTTIADAIVDATDGDELLAAVCAFFGEPDINFNNRAITLRSSAEIMQPAGGLYTMTDDAALESASGQDVTVNGELRIQSGDTADIITNQLIIDAAALVSVRPGASLFVTNPGGATLGGETSLLSNATLGFTGDASNFGSITAFGGAVIQVGGAFSSSGSTTLLSGVALLAGTITNSGLARWSDINVIADDLTNDANGNLIANGDIFAPITNDGIATYIDNTLVIGDYTNNGTTNIQIGTLTILGSLTNNGEIIGSVVSPRGSSRGTAPGDGLSITGDYIAGPNAALILPSTDWRFTVSGSYDVAVNDNTKYDMILAELRMMGPGGVARTLETMSADIGNCAMGLDRSLPGHFPIGTLRIGSTTTIVDLHDNDQSDQEQSEAIYVQNLIIESGATLNTNQLRVYYESLTLVGNVDDPNNLIAFAPLPGDFSGNCTINLTDHASFVDCVAGPDLLPSPTAPISPQQCLDAFDMDNDNDVDLHDYATFTEIFGTTSQY